MLLQTRLDGSDRKQSQQRPRQSALVQVPLCRQTTTRLSHLPSIIMTFHLLKHYGRCITYSNTYYAMSGWQNARLTFNKDYCVETHPSTFNNSSLALHNDLEAGRHRFPMRHIWSTLLCLAFVTAILPPSVPPLNRAGTFFIVGRPKTLVRKLL